MRSSFPLWMAGFLALILLPTASAACGYSGAGDWVISGALTCDGADITVNGKLLIQPLAIATFTGTTLRFNLPERATAVDSFGALHLLAATTFTTLDPNTTLVFRTVGNGNPLTIDASAVTNFEVEISGSKILFSNSAFYQNSDNGGYGAITFLGDTAQPNLITGSVIDGGSSGWALAFGYQGVSRPYANFQGLIVQGNDIRSNFGRTIMAFEAKNIIIDDNQFSLYGYADLGLTDSVVSGNTFTNQNINWYTRSISNLAFTNNKLTDSTLANGLRSHDIHVENNHFANSQFICPSGRYAIDGLTLVRNTFTRDTPALASVHFESISFDPNPDCGFFTISENVFDGTVSASPVMQFDTSYSHDYTEGRVWHNHFIASGVGIDPEVPPSLHFCVGGAGNLYEEHITNSQMPFTGVRTPECGQANLDDALDGATLSGIAPITWTRQSSFAPIHYQIYLDDTFAGDTDDLRYSLDTTRYPNGEHVLTLVPSVLHNGAPINATVNSTENLTIANAPASDPVCGNGIVEDGEECDDGNNRGGDGCHPNCKKEFCGDGHVQPGQGEECDDGNVIDGDGCDSSCILEPRRLPIVPLPICNSLYWWDCARDTTFLTLDANLPDLTYP